MYPTGSPTKKRVRLAGALELPSSFGRRPGPKGPLVSSLERRLEHPLLGPHGLPADVLELARRKCAVQAGHRLGMQVGQRVLPGPMFFITPS